MAERLLILKNGGTAGFGSGIAICPTNDAAIFIGMNQVGAHPVDKAVDIPAAAAVVHSMLLC